MTQYSINSIGDLGSKKKCITRLWDVNILTELLQDILSRLGLKDNIRASTVCKTWLEAAAIVRKLQPRPWLFYRQIRTILEDKGDYVLYDPSTSQTYQLNFPELKLFYFCYSRDGWLLLLKRASLPSLLFNPFTRECIYLPEGIRDSYTRGGFSAPPTSSSCLVITFTYQNNYKDIEFNTWRPGETVWTTYRFENELRSKWDNFLFSNGMYYFLTTRGLLKLFEPSKATWNYISVKSHPIFRNYPMLMTEHEGDIFVCLTHGKKNPLVCKLNLNRNVWEETRELGGLTVFESRNVSLTRAGLPSEMRNRIYKPHFDGHGVHDIYYYSLGDEKSSRPPPSKSNWFIISVWVDPPHIVNL